MKILYLIRHAKSSWADFNLDDIDRPLNKRGLRDAPFMAQLLVGQGVRPDALVSSPAKRAYCTAVFFAQAFDYPAADIVQRPAIYEASWYQIQQVARELNDEWKTVCLFGHNPSFTASANAFYSDYLPNLPTCGVVRVELDIERWAELAPERGRVTAIHYPKEFL